MSEFSMKAKVIRGSTWTMAGYGASRIVRLASHLILAWLLAPDIFGLMALVTIFIQGLGMFSDIGIGPSIIHSKRGNDPIFLNSAWTIQVIRGVALWMITCILAWPFAWWYAQNDPTAWQLRYLLPVAALTSVISGFNNTSIFTLNKEMRLGLITLIELGTQIVTLVVVIGWALLIHPTIWAFVAGSIAAGLVKLYISHYLIPGQPCRFQLDKTCKKELVTFGKWIMLSTAFSFLASNLDKLLLGKLMTLSELGLYGISLTFAHTAMGVTERLGSSVMFPIYSKLQNDSEKLMSVALRSRDIILFIGGGLCITILVGAPLFFQTFWDPRYHYVGTLSQYMVLSMWARILLCTMDRIPLALGNSKSLFISNIVQTSGILSAALGYIIAGLPGFIIGMALGPIAAHIYLIYFIPVQQKSMIFQSIYYSIITGFIGFLFISFNTWLNKVVSKPFWITSILVTSLLPVIISALFAYKRIRNTAQHS